MGNLSAAVEALREHPLFASATVGDCEKLAAASRWLSLRAGRRIIVEGDKADHVFVLVRGGLRVYHRGPVNERVVVKLFGAPAFLGEADGLCDIPWLETVDVVIAAEVVAIPRRAFEIFLRRNPQVTEALLRDVCKRLLATTELCRQFAFGDVAARLASHLIDYAELFGVRDGDKLIIAAVISQRQLAGDLAMSRKALQEAMSRLMQRGVIDRYGKQIVVLDEEALRAVAFPIRVRSAHSLRRAG